MGYTTPEAWPTFRTPMLESLAQAFLRRRKAIKHKSSSLLISRIENEDLDDTDGHFFIDVSWGDPRPAHARLFVWPDGGLQFQAYKPAAKGWVFQFSFTGYLDHSSGNDSVHWFEESLYLASMFGGTDEGIRQILETWREADPMLDVDT